MDVEIVDLSSPPYEPTYQDTYSLLYCGKYVVSIRALPYVPPLPFYVPNCLRSEVFTFTTVPNLQLQIHYT